MSKRKEGKNMKRYIDHAIQKWIEGDNLEEIKKIIPSVYSIHSVNKVGNSLLYLASASGSHTIFDYLVDLGARINQTNKQDINPLVISINNNHLSIAKKLISLNCDLKFNIDPSIELLNSGDIADVLTSRNIRSNLTNSEFIEIINYLLVRKYDMEDYTVKKLIKLKNAF